MAGVIELRECENALLYYNLGIKRYLLFSLYSGCFVQVYASEQTDKKLEWGLPLSITLPGYVLK